MAKLLIVEDNRNLRSMLALGLTRTGHQVQEAGNGQEALEILAQMSISLLIVDIRMPVMDGLTLIEQLRAANYQEPILAITAKAMLEDKRKAFHSGVDDYLVKPVDMEEVQLRVAALLRRAQIVQSQTLQVGGITLHQDSLTTLQDGRIIVLPQKEFFLLQTLLSYPGKIFTRQALMDEVWGYDSESDPRTVDVHIKRLREKYYNNADFVIETVRGLGYRAVVML